MIDFMQQQIDASEKLFRAMLHDHEERTRDHHLWEEVTQSLIKKLDDRDKEIAKLRSQVAAFRVLLKGK
jgi:hypothetical protein